jgi:riboflavin synthase
MFSGIIDAVGEVRSLDQTASGAALAVRAPGYWNDVLHGGSVAIDGVCLTMTGVDADAARFDVVPETLCRSTLGHLRGGDRVNLQKSLAAGDPIDGHFVQGHVDAVAKIVRVERSGGDARWWFSLPAAAMSFIIPKGSVAIDGISLTIAEVDGRAFSVALIPTTLQRTTLGEKRAGDAVNVETDILARTVVHHLESLIRDGGEGGAGALLEKLRATGFA